MGYTNYWTFSKPKRVKGNAAKTEQAYQAAIKDCNTIILYYQAQHPKGSNIDYMRLSGYSAHVKAGTYGGININGKQDYAHEGFNLPEHFRDNISKLDNAPGFGFCKTNRKPYDIVVKACLLLLKMRLGDLIEIDSDSNDDTDWNPPKQLIADALGIYLLKSKKRA